jgi:hypothetical protein
MAFSTTAFKIMTLSKMKLGLRRLSITIVCVVTLTIRLSMTLLSMIAVLHHSEPIVLNRKLSVILQNDVMLKVVVPVKGRRPW